MDGIGVIEVSPADLIMTYLIESGLAHEPEALAQNVPGRFYGFIGHFPANPPAIIVASDSLGKQDGRLMSGPVIEHPGLQIRVRHPSYLAAYGRIAAVQKLFDLTRNRAIPSADGPYLLESVSRVGGIAYLGRLDGTGLEQMAANFNLSIRKL